ncbi:MAG: hypothetical protein KJO50_05275, partial [Bacteroidia bacterium]|nr:hypothetical protein [Bacteroidia bacterium]
IIFLIGIYMGLDSISDVNRMSEKELSFFRNIKNIKIQSTIIVVSIIMTVIVSILFISLKFIFPSHNTILFNELFNLGLDCWALILGLFCILKGTYDKHYFATKSNSIKN